MELQRGLTTPRRASSHEETARLVAGEFARADEGLELEFLADEPTGLSFSRRKQGDVYVMLIVSTKKDSPADDLEKVERNELKDHGLVLSQVNGADVVVEASHKAAAAEEDFIGVDRPVTLYLETKAHYVSRMGGGGGAPSRGGSVSNGEAADDAERTASDDERTASDGTADEAGSRTGSLRTDSRPEADDVLEWVTAKADYEGTEEGDLTFRAGDTIGVTRRDDDAWHTGFVYQEDGDERPGQFPINYVEPM